MGPRVRAAGRMVLQRDKGKLQFLDIRDWTGQIQLFIGRDQVGEENWSSCGASTWATSSASTATAAYQDGRIDDLRRRLHFLCKSLETPPEKHHGLTDPNCGSGCGTSI